MPRECRRVCLRLTRVAFGRPRQGLAMMASRLRLGLLRDRPPSETLHTIGPHAAQQNLHRRKQRVDGLEVEIAGPR